MTDDMVKERPGWSCGRRERVKTFRKVRVSLEEASIWLLDFVESIEGEVVRVLMQHEQ